MILNFNQDKEKSQQINDFDERGKRKPWAEKKALTERFAAYVEQFDEEKAQKIRDCGTRLIFAVDKNGKHQLIEAYFCRMRLCPMCAWRRSLAIYAQMRKVLQEMPQETTYTLLTLTCANVFFDDLKDTINEMMAAFRRLHQRKDMKKAIKGFYRALEITYNNEKFITPEMAKWKSIKNRGLKAGDDNPFYNTYHPHFHILLAHNKSYFTSRDYLSQDKITEMWKDALRINYDPIIDIRKVKIKNGQPTEAAIAEVCKYPVKPKSYDLPDDIEAAGHLIEKFDKALKGRRLIGLGGCFREIQKKITGEETINEDQLFDEETNFEAITKIAYIWAPGLRAYKNSKEALEAYEARQEHRRQVAAL